MATLIGDLTLVQTVTDTPQLALSDSVEDVVTLTLGGTVYAFAASQFEGGVQSVRVDPDGTLQPLDAAFASSQFPFFLPFALEAVDFGVSHYVFASGDGGGITSIRIGANGALTPVAFFADTAGTALDGVVDLAQFSVGGNQFLAAPGFRDSGLTILRINGATGTLTATDAAFDGDNPAYSLSNARAVEVASIQGRTFAYSGGSEDGVTIFEVTGSGQLTYVATERPAFGRIDELTAFDAYGRSLLFAGSLTDFTIYEIGADGRLTPFSIRRSSDPIAGDTDFFMVEGALFMLRADRDSAQLELSGIGRDGTITPLQTLEGGPSSLALPAGIAFVESAQGTFALVTARNTLNSFKVGDGDDALVGSDQGDRIIGLEGADDLIGRGGDDALFGGAGGDVLSGGTGDDTLEGGAGDDTLAGGAGDDTLVGGAGKDFLGGGDGEDTATFADAGEGLTISLPGEVARGASGARDRLDGIEHVVGTPFEDTITGNGARNTLFGGTSGDSIDGLVEKDVIYGGNGADRLEGERGADDIYGDNGADTLFGGALRDRLYGGNGADRFYGGAGNDLVFGGNGADVIFDSAGDDIYRGQVGDDRFVFNTLRGADIIFGFSTRDDVVDLRGNAAFGDFADVSAALITLGGSTFLVSGSSSVEFDGIAAGVLTADDFLF